MLGNKEDKANLLLEKINKLIKSVKGLDEYFDAIDKEEHYRKVYYDLLREYDTQFGYYVEDLINLNIVHSSCDEVYKIVKAKIDKDNFYKRFLNVNLGMKKVEGLDKAYAYMFDYRATQRGSEIEDRWASYEKRLKPLLVNEVND